MTSLWYKCPFASAAFFCSKNSRHSSDGSVGMSEALGADAVRMSVLAIWLRRFSKLFLLDPEPAEDWSMSFCSTSCLMESAILLMGLVSESVDAFGDSNGGGSTRYSWSFLVACWMEDLTEYWAGTPGICPL